MFSGALCWGQGRLRTGKGLSSYARVASVVASLKAPSNSGEVPDLQVYPVAGENDTSIGGWGEVRDGLKRRRRFWVGEAHIFCLGRFSE